MKKYLLFLGVVWMISSCCSKQEDCKCPLLVLNFVFECFSEKELSDFRIIKYDSTTGTLVSSENLNFIRTSGTAQHNINLETDTKYDIEFVNKPLGIYRRFSKFNFAIVDNPLRCYDCKTKIRYKTCRQSGSINFLVNGRPIYTVGNLRSEESTYFKGFNEKNCNAGYAYKAIKN